ncbi:MAG: hydrogenase maturation protease [Promethearchaeota archaeon]
MSFLISKETKTELKKILQSFHKILVLGIGEVNMRDDGFGPYITVFFTSNKESNERVHFINGKTTPEIRKQEIIQFKPDLMLLIDTCKSGDAPGTLILAKESELVNYLPISSHTLPVQIFIKVLKEDIPDLKTYLLGVNPVSMESAEERYPYNPEKYSLDDYEEDPNLPFFKINLTPKIKKIADETIKLLKEILL